MGDVLDRCGELKGGSLCPKCKRAVFETDLFCPGCATSLIAKMAPVAAGVTTYRCHLCNADLAKKKWKFCPACARNLCEEHFSTSEFCVPCSKNHLRCQSCKSVFKKKPGNSIDSDQCPHCGHSEKKAQLARAETERQDRMFRDSVRQAEKKAQLARAETERQDRMFRDSMRQAAEERRLIEEREKKKIRAANAPELYCQICFEEHDSPMHSKLCPSCSKSYCYCNYKKYEKVDGKFELINLERLNKLGHRYIWHYNKEICINCNKEIIENNVFSINCLRIAIIATIFAAYGFMTYKLFKYVSGFWWLFAFILKILTIVLGLVGLVILFFIVMAVWDYLFVHFIQRSVNKWSGKSDRSRLEK